MERHKNGFLRILQRYIDQKSLPEEKRLLDVWYESLDEGHVEKQQELVQKGVDEKIWSNIQAKKSPNDTHPVQTEINWWRSSSFRMAAAAVVFLMLGFVYYKFNAGNSDSPVKGVSRDVFASLTKVRNSTDGKQGIRLADGSQVTLEPGATLYFPKSFDSKNRTVYLVGNGFFEIAKNPAKPFLVFSEQIVTKVLGTSFTIKKEVASENIEVAVVTGKVIVERAQGSKPDFLARNGGVILTPNEKVTYSSESDKYVTGIVDHPVMIEESQDFKGAGSFIFEESALKDVIGKLEKAYGVQITIVNQTILNCPITADLSQSSLFSKLEVINALLNTKFEIVETSIILNGGECPPFKSAHDNP